MTIRRATTLIFALAALTATARPARADLQLCSRMSYVVEAAIAIEDKGAVASRGWFRVDPGACRTVLQGALPGGTLYLHARALPVYGGSPLPQQGNADFCVGADNFVMANARACRRSSEQLVRFTAVKPAESDKGLNAYLAEDAEYDDTQARDAAIQRLLTIAGYDPGTIDGVRGSKTDVALAQFIADNKLTNTAAGRSDIFDVLIAAGRRPGSGFSWCNDTANAVIAALGVEEQGTVVTRGWYRVAPGKCLRPDLTGRPQRLYSFGEAVDADGQPLRRSTQPGSPPVSWGGSNILCTRSARFELSEHQDCAGKGLNSTGFAPVELGGGTGTVIRFK
jgi:uncharacterized membrane protein